MELKGVEPKDVRVERRLKETRARAENIRLQNAHEDHNLKTGEGYNYSFRDFL